MVDKPLLIAACSFGWCLSGDHLNCPVVDRGGPWPDPARKGATYERQGRICPCVCHTRPPRLGTESN